MADPNAANPARALVGHRTVTHADITRFGALTGDYAAMHLDRTFGPANGMEGTIAHGLLSGAWSLGALAQHAPERLALGDPDAYLAGYAVRFHRMVFVDDRFALRWTESEQAAIDGLVESDRIDTRFEVLNQREELVTSGAVSVATGSDGKAPPMPGAPAPLEIDPAWSLDGVSLPIHADEMVECGPRGESRGRTFTEADGVNWTDFTGELDPAITNAPWAERSRFGGRIAPPMWVFCRAFGDYLRDLLRVSMPSTGFAGHLGDRFRTIAPVHLGDTLRTRHRPVGFSRSKSRPGMGLVEFALEVVNQRDEIVQEGRVTMMMGARPGGA